jgi:hypothetical protein
MANRQTTHILKNSDIVNRPLPTSLLKGEPIINTADGIMYFSGVTQSTNEWTPAGTGSTASFFEVGSNLYDLRLRNQITQYQGQTSGLAGKFLSGTTTGFVLANISDITNGTNTYVTGGTWVANTLTLGLSDGSTASPITIDNFNNLSLYGTTNVNGDLTVTGTSSLQTVTSTNINVNNVYVGGNLTANTANISTLNSTDLFVTGTEIVNNLTITGTGLYNTTPSGSNPNEIINYGYLTGFVQTADVYVTGSSLTQATNNTDTQTSQLLYHGNPIGGPYSIVTENTFTTGGTYDNTTKNITFTKNDGTTYPVDLSSIDVNDTYVTGGTSTGSSNSSPDATISLEYNQDIPNGTYSLNYKDTFVTGGTYSSGTISFSYNDNTKPGFTVTGIDGTDTYVTGFTYNPLNNTITLSQNEGEPDLFVTISSMSGLTINGNLTVTGNTSLGPTTATTIDAGIIYSGGTNLLTIIDNNDTFVTGFTYNPTNNSLTISRNQGEPDLVQYINSFSGLSVTNLTSGQVVYVGPSGELKTESGFEYNESTDLLTIGNLIVNNPSGSTAIIGQGGLIIGSGGSTANPGIGDLIVHGNFTVYGTGTTITTNELYIEDPTITLNYNPSGSSTTTSIGSGIVIQDGSGIAGTDSTLQIGQLFGNTNINSNTEYTALTGNANRGLFTQLNDILIRNTNGNSGAPDGKRVLAEDDILDGGIY